MNYKIESCQHLAVSSSVLILSSSGAFSRREVLVAMLESRAGAPAWGPELLARHQLVGILDTLPDLYKDWETWAADVAESHSTYPIPLLFHSPEP